MIMDHLQHLHLGLFFIWRRYYEVMKRLLGIRYKYDGKVQNSQNHIIDYIKPGRVIVAQILLGIIVLLYKVYKSFRKAKERWA